MGSRPQTPERAPLISVVLPTYRPRRRYLRQAIASVRAQRHPGWELCVVDDGSGDRRLARVLRRLAAADPRIRVEIRGRNEGISAASNRGVAMSRGEFVAFLDHDDTFAPDALGEVAAAIDADPAADVVYSDQDKLTPRGARVAPFLKPDWSPVYVLGAMYVGHLLVVRRSLVDEVGGFDPAFDGIQDFELLLRVSELTDRIRHVARILYHWRAIPGSIAAGADEKSGVPELQARAVSEHLRRRGVTARAVPNPRIAHRARLVPEASAERTAVTVIVAGVGEPCDVDRCVAAARRTRHPGLEVIVAEPRGPGVAAALNRSAAAASGDQLVFVAPEVELADPGSIAELLVHAGLPGVGIVGPVLLHPDGRVREAGLALRRWQPRADGAGRRPRRRPAATRGSAWWHGSAPAVPLMPGLGAEQDGYYGSLSCAREVGAVSATCMMVSRAAFEHAGGFDERYHARYHDVDLCLRVRRAGLAVVCAPRPRVVVHDRRPASPPEDMVDRALLVDRWYDDLDRGDPYLNSGLSAGMIPAAGPRPTLLRRVASRI
jgi:GT2 family glycosyltransferase